MKLLYMYDNITNSIYKHVFADLRLSKWEEAVKDCNTVLKMEPKNVKGRKSCQVIIYHHH